MSKTPDRDILTRYNLLNGNLETPGFNKIKDKLGKEVAELTDKMFQAMWKAYLLNKGGISLPYWSNKFNNPATFNIILMSLSKAGWIDSHSIPSKNWAEANIKESKLLSIVTMQELESIRARNKFQKYIITNKAPISNDRVRRGGKTVKTGLIRDGFKAAGNTEFTFDKEMMIEYYDVIVAQLVKGMDKVRELWKDMRRDGASYDEVAKEILDYYIQSDEVYKLGENISDSRGRAIYQILKKVFNPISNKEARSLLVIPEEQRLPTTQDALDTYYLFIAELNGFKNGTVEEKKAKGLHQYLSYKLLDLDWRVEDDRKEVYENIWLERIYRELDIYFKMDTFQKRIERTRYTKTNAKWLIEGLLETDSDYRFSVPVEVDASASCLQYIGVLLNHKPFMERTNLIGDTLQDAWTIEGIKSRAQVKVIMRTIYGSNQPCQAMWEDEGIEYEKGDIARYNNELRHGSLAVADRFKNFILNGVKVKERMTVKIWDDEFEIECNKFKVIGDKTISYDIFDTDANRIKRIHNTTTKKVMDLESFKLYFITLLIHNLDSNVANKVSLKIYNLFKWIISIHDAFIIHPSAATATRREYARLLEEIHTNRKEILANYTQSIGVNKTSQEEWKKVEEAVEHLEEEFKCSDMALK